MSSSRLRIIAIKSSRVAFGEILSFICRILLRLYVSKCFRNGLELNLTVRHMIRTAMPKSSLLYFADRFFPPSIIHLLHP
jgi:hypothetical protein